MELREQYKSLFETVKRVYSEHSIEMIERALGEAIVSLEGQTRWDGTPLVAHSVNGAMIVAGEIGLGRNSTIAMLLHDAVRFGASAIDINSVGERYGEEVVAILKGLNLISTIRTNRSVEQVDTFRDMIVSYSSDPRVILIKLADRLEVMRHLAMFPEQKRQNKSWETMNLYAPIAHKLGLYAVKSEMEDLALRYLEPVEYASIRSKLDDSAPELEQFIADFTAPIKQRLTEQGFKFHTKGRTKSVYSVWRKMHKSGIPFEQVYDIFAIRIIIDCPVEQEKNACWDVYSVVTDFYTPNPDRLRDWISIHKSNGYESLHTTVVTKEGRWVEVQIRSERMDAVAERGIAAHWRYKGVSERQAQQQEWFGRVRELLETDVRDLPHSLDLETEGETGEVFVFTPNGDLRKLPEGATVLDFAYDIHSGLGERCTGAQIGGRNVPIKERLHNGDIVTVLTAKNQYPKADWLKIVKTSKARSRIKIYLREQKQKQAQLGREELERKIKNWKLSVAIDDAVTALCKYFKYKTGLELYARIADEKINMNDVRSVLERYVSGELFASKTKAAINVSAKESADNDTLIIDETIRAIQYKMARCCNPVRGDSVFGFTTISNGITIHRNDCPNAPRLHEMYPYRIIEARWKESLSGTFLARINIVTDDSVGMIARISDCITHELKLNIRSLSLSPTKNGMSGIITIEVPSAGVLDAAVFNLARLKGVLRAYRVSGGEA